MTAHQLEAIEKQLRRAIEERRYEDARAQAAVYSEASAKYLAALSDGSERQTYLMHARDTFDWAQNMVIAARGLLARQLAQLPPLHPKYRPEPAPPRWDIEG